MNSKELLSKFLNDEISRDQLKIELSKETPLLFTIESDSEPTPESLGYYEDEKGKRIYKPLSWYREESKNRNVSILILPPPNGKPVLTIV